MKPLSFKDADSLARERGWFLHHVAGSHHIYRKSGDTRVVVIPRHNGDMPVGTARNILRALGIDPASYR